MKKCIRTIVLIFVVFQLFLTFGCEKEKPVQKTLYRPVRFTVVKAKVYSNLRTFTGIARSSEELDLSFNVSGTLRQLNVKVGDMVQKGKILGKLDIKDYLPDVQRTEASLKNVQAQARNAKASYNRIRAMYENNSASAEQLDSARASHESSQANVASTRKQLEMARIKYSYTSLISPKKGRISAVLVEVNENVNQGSPVISLDAGTKFDVNLEIPEKFITQIKEGQNIQIKFGSIKNRIFPSVVTEVGVSPDQKTTTYSIVAQLAESDIRIRAGMAAEAIFNFSSKKEVSRIFLPSFAVSEDQKGRFVYILENIKDGFAITKRVSVVVGELTVDGILIKSGVSIGDKIVTAGTNLIKDQQKVKFLENLEK